jgi:type II secretory pathway component PulJ
MPPKQIPTISLEPYMPSKALTVRLHEHCLTVQETGARGGDWVTSIPRKELRRFELWLHEQLKEDAN